MTDTASRLLNLLSLLQARRDWSGTELAQRLEISRRTVRRDVERLRDLGYPVESVAGPAGGYRLRAGTAMPPLLVDDDEAIALAIGLRTAARAAVSGIDEAALRALVKLEQVLPSHLRRRVQALQAATATLPPGGPTVDPQALTVTAAACRDKERLRFAYEGRDGTRTRREVEPQALVHLGRRWYLVAWDPQRADWRTFRLDRLANPQPTGVRSTPREPPAEDIATYVAQRLNAAPHRYEARVRLHASAETLRRRMPYAYGAIEPIDETTSEYRTGDDDLEWLALRIVMLGADFELDGPPELRATLEALAKRIERATT